MEKTKLTPDPLNLLKLLQLRHNKLLIKPLTLADRIIVVQSFRVVREAECTLILVQHTSPAG